MRNEEISDFSNYHRWLVRANYPSVDAESSFNGGSAMSLIRKIVGRPTETETAGPTENLSGPVERDARRTGGTTPGIARNVELYNLAFKLAWKYISEHQKLYKPDIARQLHDSIRRELTKGASEATFIASEALKDLGY